MKVVFGSFDSFDEADAAIRELNLQGIDDNRLNIVANEPAVRDRLEVGPSGADLTPSETVATGAGTGAMAGAAVGGLGGILMGLGALAIPGLGPVFAVGTLASAVTTGAAGAGIGGLAGAAVGTLSGWGIGEEESRIYSAAVQRGGILVAVQTEKSNVSRVRATLHDAGAVDIEVLRNRLNSDTR